MVHQCQRLSLGFKSGGDLFGIQSLLDDFERNFPFDRFPLLGHPYAAHSSFTDFLQQLVATDLLSARLLRIKFRCRILFACHISRGVFIDQFRTRLTEETIEIVLKPKVRFQFSA